MTLRNQEETGFLLSREDFDMKNLYGKNVFITGASSGIGKATAIAFAKEGCNVIGVSRHCREGIKKFANGGSIRFMRMDVTDEEQVNKVLSGIDEVDIAVLAAGYGIGGPVAETPISNVKRQLDVNYLGVLSVVQQVIPKMHANNKGLIVVIGSVAGKVSIPMQSAYSASKYAIEALVDAIRIEEAKYGIKATVVNAGDTCTGFTSARLIYEAPDSVYAEDIKHAIGIMENDEKNGMSPSRLAKAVVKLASKKNPPHRITVGLNNKLFMMAIKHMPDNIVERVVTNIYMK